MLYFSYLVCETPPDAQDNAVTFPAVITGQFLVGDQIVYSCNGDLIPDTGTVNTCLDNGPLLSTWQISMTNGLPECSKITANAQCFFVTFLNQFEKYYN